MVEASLRILAVVGTLQRNSTSSVVIEHIAALLRKSDCVVDVLDFKKEPLALFDPDTTYQLPGYTELQGRVDRADVIILATLDYHGSVSGAMKNFSTISGGNLRGSYLQRLSLRWKRD
jgi:NAD(P)H-dependent FMN reductase